MENRNPGYVSRTHSRTQGARAYNPQVAFSLFNQAAYPPQPAPQPALQPGMPQMNPLDMSRVDPGAFIAIMMELVKEVKLQNDLIYTKMQNKEKEKQQAQQKAADASAADQKRFDEVKSALFT